MSPRLLVVSTTYRTRVALEKLCKERQGSVNWTVEGQPQLKDSHNLKRKFCNFENIGCSQINENAENELSRSGLDYSGVPGRREGAASDMSRHSS